MSRVSFSTSTSERQFDYRQPARLAYVIVVMLILHVVWSSIIVLFLNSFHNHRIINLKNWKNEGNQWEEITSIFANKAILEARENNKPSMLFLGSSVTYGFPYKENGIFSNLIANKSPEYHVANLSIVGAGIDALTDFATCSLDISNRPDILIVEIPLVNSISSISSKSESFKRVCTHTTTATNNYWPMILSRPYGAQWVRLLWEETVAEMPAETIIIAQLPANFFADSRRFEQIRSKYESALRRYLNDVSQMGSKVFVYVSPIYTPGISFSGGDRTSVEEQIALTQAICQAHEKVTCLDTSTSGLRREHYFNLTHLNHKGHRAFSEWMAEQVLAQDGEIRKH